MLKFIFGRSGYGKTEYVFNCIKKNALNGKDNILLITPEQYSLIAERHLLTDLGEERVAYVENSSFTRLSNEVYKKYGGVALPTLSKGGKTILMMQAINQSKDKLTLFNKKLDSLSFVTSMIKIYDEMKSCNLSGSEIIQLSQEIKSEILFRKLNDISIIMNCYEDIISDKFTDASDELKRLYEKIKSRGFFKGKKVYIDGFNGFVAQEYKLLELIINEADDVTITLCTDSADSVDKYNLFAYVNNSARILEKIARKNNVEIKSIVLDKNYRTDKKDLLNIEKNIFTNSVTDQSGNDNTEIYLARNISDECSQASRKIKSLLRNGYKASDITVIARDINKYRDELSYSFKKYDIPYYNDERQPINTQPIVVLIKYLLRAVNSSLRSDDILSLAKTGLTTINSEKINNIENYIYLWNINGSKWTKPFENSTKGFVNEISPSDRKLLNEINSTREQLIAPILSFKNVAKGKNAKSICESIYNTLIYLGADKKLQEYAVELSNNGFLSLAEEQGRVWDLVMEILNQMAITITEQISLRNFEKLFDLIISTEDLGTLPSGIDNVQFGQADRIRTDNPKAVFILGANEGEFPQEVSGGGLLSENERKIMLENDFKLYSYGEILNLQERYFAYMACSAPTEKLFISYIGNSSSSTTPSEIVTEIKNILPNIKECSFNDLKDIDLIESKENAFELMSERYFSNNPFYSSLKEYFKNDSRYKAVENLAENKPVIIDNKSISTQLFGKNMYISASRIEDYYNCPFRYFCKFGLNARLREKAEINPMQRGTVIHYVLEMILSQVGSSGLSKLTRSEIINLVDSCISDYFNKEMGSVTDLSKRFNYNFKRLSKLIYSVVFHLAEEFSNSSFEAKAFELSIDKDGEVEPEVISLDDGGTVQIRGSIDRVDTYEHNGEKYVRVVDYKSGNKTFKLSDILSGLNLQMFVYLFSLCSDKNADLSGIPAGVLYMHAARNVFIFDSRSSADQKVDKEENSSYKMKGIVLSDEDGEIANAMENDLKGKYIPVKIKANGELTGQFATLQELGMLHNKVNELIAQMGNELHLGNISHNPIKNSGHKNTCEFCDYGDICANKRLIEEKEAPDYSDDEVKEILRKEFEQDA